MPLEQFGTFFYLNLQRVEDNEPIPPSALHSLDDGKTLRPIFHGDTVGQTPKDFSKDRSFWKPVLISRVDDEYALKFSEMIRSGG